MHNKKSQWAILLAERQNLWPPFIIVGNSVQIAGLERLSDLVAADPHISVLAAVVAWPAYVSSILLPCHCSWVVDECLALASLSTRSAGPRIQRLARATALAFEHLPFIGVQTEKASMQKASRLPERLCGRQSDVFRRCPTLAALWAWRSVSPGASCFSVRCSGRSGVGK